MKKSFISFILMLFAAISLQAQATMSDINRIKRNKSYLYGEATLNTKEAALKLAYELLEAEIKNWAQQKNTDISSVIAANIQSYADTIILARGNMIRAFAFVKSSDLKPIKGRQIVVNEPQRATPTPAEPQQNSATPAEPRHSDPKPAEAERSDPMPVEAEHTDATAPIEAEPAPKAEPVPENTTAEHVKTAEELVVERLMNVSSFRDLEKTMKPMKDAGLITEYGKYTTMNDPANCYLIVYDQQAAIKALLGKGTDTRPNLKTGQPDSEKNYHGCGALWFKVREE